MAVPRKEKAYKKYAWALPLIWGLIVVVIGFHEVSSGYAPDHPALPASTPTAAINALNSYYQGLAFVIFFLRLSFMLVSATGFRLGQKWAWYFVLA